MNDTEHHSWLIEINPSVRPVGPIADYSEAEALFERYIGRQSKYPVKLLQFTCDGGLPTRFPVGTHAAIEGAVQGGYGEIDTLRELDLKGCEVVPEVTNSLTP